MDSIQIIIFVITTVSIGGLALAFTLSIKKYDKKPKLKKKKGRNKYMPQSKNPGRK